MPASALAAIWRGGFLPAACRLVIAALFLLAAAGKIASPQAFAETIAAFELLPTALIHPTAILLPWLEAVAAIALVSPTSFRAAGGIILMTLLTAFTLAMIWVIARGIDTECGCFGKTWLSGSIGWPHVVRNLLLTAALAVGLLGPNAGETRNDDPINQKQPSHATRFSS